jgi:hypothetical protein
VDNSQCTLNIKFIEVVLQRLIILQTHGGEVRVFRDDLKSAVGGHSIALRIPPDTYSSMVGELVKCSYSIITRCHLEGWFC